MADKMLRMAGRSASGQAKALKTDEQGNLGVVSHVRNIVLVNNEQISTQPDYVADLSKVFSITSVAGTWVHDQALSILKASAFGTNLVRFNDIAQETDLDITMTTSTVSTTGGDYAAPAWRIIDGDNYYSIHPTTGGTGELRKYVGGVKSVVKVGSFVINPAQQISYRIKMIGSAIEVYVNGELWASGTDTQHANGYIGAINYASGSESRVHSIMMADTTVTDPYRQANINAFGTWTILLSASTATNISLQLSGDGVKWFSLPENPLKFDSAGDKIIEIGYLAKAIRIRSTSDAILTAHIFGAVNE